MVHNVQSPNRRLNHLQGVHSHITVDKNSESHMSIPLWCTKGMLTRFYGAQKSLPSATWRDDCHGTCETLRSAERQGPTDSEPVGLANSTTPLILYRLQKESSEDGMSTRNARGIRELKIVHSMHDARLCTNDAGIRGP